MIIAIDGPAGSGKSTLAKEIASELNISYLDTGAMYRIVTLFFLEQNIAVKEVQKKDVQYLKDNIKIMIQGDNFFLNEEDVSLKIREDRVANKVSEIAAIKQVREFLVEAQRKIGKQNDSILDGRDIGTVVFPLAEVKIYLIADPQVRAKRRVEQNEKLGIASNFEEVLELIKKRDNIDSTREESPLKKAKDAIEVDTSNISINEAKNKILDIIRKRQDEV